MAHLQYLHRGAFPMQSHGSIHVICGPMFSGKTTELLRRMKRFSLAKRRCMLIKYANDNRYGMDGITTHDMRQSAAVACSKLEEAREQANAFDVLGIDEGQFFPDVVEFCEGMAKEGKTVIVAALDGTFQRKPFGTILDLIPLSESVIKLSAVCMLCHREAAFSKRIGSETEIEVIGGADKYIAVCRECFYKGDTNQVAEKEKKRECVAQQALEDTPLSPNTEYSDNSDDNSNSSLEVSYFNSDIQRSFGIDNDDDTPLKNKTSYCHDVRFQEHHLGCQSHCPASISG
eukprot:gene7453-531_t